MNQLSSLNFFVPHFPQILFSYLEEEMAAHSYILAWRIPMGRGAWQSTVHGVAELDMTELLSTFSY